MPDWPHWWRFELELSPHVIERMEDRGFSEVDLRAMLEDATAYRESLTPGRFVISTKHADSPWEIVLEPDELEEALIVVTAYEVQS